MAKVGYIRVSTIEQNTERQLDGIQLDKTFEDKVSGANTDRPQLRAMLEYVREGDTVIVHDISRLARNLEDLLNIVNTLTRKEITVHFVKESLLFTGDDSPMQSLMLSMLGAVYQFERAMIKERQREGVQIAKAAGKYKGRTKTINDESIRSVIASGASFRKAAAQLGVSLSTVQRAMREV